MGIINVDNLSKSYKIHKKPAGFRNTLKDFLKREYIYNHAVAGLSFEIERGSIVGLLGENGAGKTTTLKLLSGILYPTEGRVIVLGYNPVNRDKTFLKKIAFIMGNKSDVNWDLPAIDTFMYQKLIYEIPDNVFNGNVSMLSEMLHVTDLLYVQVRRLSLGERMKIEFINNFLYNPEVIFLDEPTIGLDINSQDSIRKFIVAYRTEKKATIIITSHYMDDIDETCDRVIVLNKGVKTHDRSVDDLRNTDTPFRESVRNLLNQKD